MLLPKIIQNIITLKSSPNGGLFCAFSGWQITADQDFRTVICSIPGNGSDSRQTTPTASSDC